MMQQRELGKHGPVVSALGLGAMGMSGMYGPSDRSESIHAALDAGIILIDTGDFYGTGHNEMLIAAALKGMSRDKYRRAAAVDPISERRLRRALPRGGHGSSRQ